MFSPSSSPPLDTSSALWLYFRGAEVLLAETSVLHAAPLALGLATPTFARYLGTFDERPCFVAELPASAESPSGARFGSLRAAFLSLPPTMFDVLAGAAEVLHFERTHRFCGTCGAELVAKVDDRARRCDACAVEYYPRISPAIIVLVHDGSRVLLTNAGGRPFFALVAGFLETGETLEACVAREVREETGVEVSDVRYFGSQAWPFPSQVMVGFFARYAGGDIVVDRRELDHVAWYEKGALPELPPPISIARRLIDAWIASVDREC
jgi:NAD+ diphosphatase